MSAAWVPDRQNGSQSPWRTWTRPASPSDLNLPGYRLHPLKGDRRGFWSLSISANWRILFRFEEGDAYDVDLVDS